MFLTLLFDSNEKVPESGNDKANMTQMSVDGVTKQMNSYMWSKELLNFTFAKME